MKCIRKETDDGSWHDITTELPNMTADVEVRKADGTIEDAEIVVEMAGWYLYFREGEHQGWSSLSYYTHWRFKKK